jgi:glycosyltransferase involved in cell wall biosynthesis
MTVETEPSVTIAIPTFNRAKSFFPLALKSACSQSYSHLEILVADNASTDETRAVVEEAHDPRIRYHRHPTNIGATNNQEFCLQDARGSYLTILPDDDLIDPDFVESCVALALQHRSAGVIRTGTRVIDKDDRPIREIPNPVANLSFDDFVLAWINGRTSPYQCSSMFRTDALRAAGFHTRHHLFDDVSAHFKVAAHEGRADMSGIKASFRMHGNSGTDQANMLAWCQESMDLLNLLCELSPVNRQVIRTVGMRFLAFGNYRRALRKSLPRRLLACFTVFCTHNFTPLPRALMADLWKT